jgi:hypothetical protein
VKAVVYSLPIVILLAALGHNLASSLRGHWQAEADLFQAQNWVRRQPDLTGLAISPGRGRCSSGAYLVTDRHLPPIYVKSNLPSTRIISHLIVYGQTAKTAKDSTNWEPLNRFGRFDVLRRRDRLIQEIRPSTSQ